MAAGGAVASALGGHDPVKSEELAAVFATAGCPECHVADGAASETRLIFPKAGAPAALLEQAATTLADLIDNQDLARSRLLRKPTKRLSHEGGQRIVPGHPEEGTLLAWLAGVRRAGRPDRLALRELLTPRPSIVPWPVRFDGGPSPLRRLSRDELAASLEVLTGSAPARGELPDDPRQGHGMLLTVGTPFIASEILQLKVALNDFIARSVPDILERTACTENGQAQRECLGAWVAAFGARALRRPPIEEERSTWRTILAASGESSDADRAALQAVLTSIFLSPSFLYRSEVGTPIPRRPGVRALDADEIATRLSFLATLAPPDAELVAAARAGRLSEGGERARHLDRLFAGELGRRAQAVFVLEWLGANEDKASLKSIKYLKAMGADFESSLRSSAEAAIRHVLSDGAAPTVAGLLTTTAYLEDEVIQRVTRSSTVAKRTTGDTEETGRRGLLMHPHVLAAHTKEDGASPFQIGVFIRETLLCERVPTPPANAAASARTDVPPGLSLRESLEFRTSAEKICTSCHQTFSALGFAFLPFDPVGRWSAEDPSGRPWDLSGHVPTHSGLTLTFQSPAELVQSLAEDPQVHGCFAQAALKWAFGRGLVPQDRRLIVALNEVARRTRGNVAEIFRTIVSSPEFSTAVATR